jgi:predicted nucleotidyltransferase component of viral defense system
VQQFRELNEFGPTIDAAAGRLRISATAVEKDYWVSQVLRVLAHNYKGDFIFKGGTSLSKGYQIVERFSEDIDILVLPGARGRGATDKLMKAMGAATASGIGGEASSVGGSETGRHRCYELSYPTTREATGFVRTSVLLEMGVRGGDHPNELVPISCLLGDVLKTEGTSLSEFADLEPFEVVVLHPGRTLLEKLVHVHAVAQTLGHDVALAPDRRIGRHFYDVYQLLGDEHTLQLLTDPHEITTVMSSIETVTREHFGGTENSELRPDGGFAASPAFAIETDVSSRLRTSYEATMPELYFGAAPPPTWEAICRRVAEMRNLL